MAEVLKVAAIIGLPGKGRDGESIIQLAADAESDPLLFECIEPIADYKFHQLGSPFQYFVVRAFPLEPKDLLFHFFDSGEELMPEAGGVFHPEIHQQVERLIFQGAVPLVAPRIVVQIAKPAIFREGGESRVAEASIVSGPLQGDGSGFDTLEKIDLRRSRDPGKAKEKRQD